MRIARFSLNDKPRYAFVQQDPADGKDYLIELDGYPFGAAPVKPTGERYALDADGLRLLAPVIPSKVYGLAKNYEAHAQFMHESGHSEIAHAPEDMVIFSKPSTSVIGPDDPIVIPSYSNDMNFEPEVAVIMGRIAKNVPVEKAMDYVLGFTCVNDVTLRDLQGLDPMWTRAKGFDTSCPIGPWIQTELDWKDAKISFTLNGDDPWRVGHHRSLVRRNDRGIASAMPDFADDLRGFRTVIGFGIAFRSFPVRVRTERHRILNLFARCLQYVLIDLRRNGGDDGSGRHTDHRTRYADFRGKEEGRHCGKRTCRD